MRPGRLRRQRAGWSTSSGYASRCECAERRIRAPPAGGWARASRSATGASPSTAGRSATWTRPSLRQVRDYVRNLDENLEPGPRAVVLRRRRHRQDLAGDAGLQGRAGGRAVGGDLLDAAPAGRDPRDLRPRVGLGSYSRFFRRLCSVDLLHLDDLGAEHRTDWVLEQLYSIVNERWQDQRAMVVTTNVSDLDELREQIGTRTVSRLTEMCDAHPDLRRRPAHDRRRVAPGLDSDRYAGTGDSRRPVGRRGQGQGGRPDRRAGRRRRSASRAATTPATPSSATARCSSSTSSPRGSSTPGKVCAIGNGVVVDPQVLTEELDALRRRGLDIGGLKVSANAHLIMPYHLLLDHAGEAKLGDQKIGTTRRGIGPVLRRQGGPAGDPRAGPARREDPASRRSPPRWSPRSCRCGRSPRTR